MADYGGGKHSVRIQLYCGVNKLFRGNAGAQVMHLYPVLLYAAVLYVYYLPKADAVLILAHRAAHNLHGPALYVGAYLIVAHHVRLLWKHELVYLYAEWHLALSLYARAFRGVHYLLGDDLYVGQPHLAAALYRRSLGYALIGGEEHC